MVAAIGVVLGVVVAIMTIFQMEKRAIRKPASAMVAAAAIGGAAIVAAVAVA